MNHPADRGGPNPAAELVIGPYPVTWGDRGERSLPTRAMVFASESGHFEVVTRRPSMFQAGRYSHRYDVDLSHHPVDWQTELESGTAGFRFQAELSATWAVSDAAKVAQQGIRTVAAADDVVRKRFTQTLRSWTRNFGIKADKAAEDHLNQTYGESPQPLPEGITVVSFRIHLSHSAEAEAIVKVPFLTDARFDEAAAEARLLDLRKRVIEAAAARENGLLIHLIAQNPADMRSILQEAALEARLDLDRKQALFNSLVEQKFIQPADIETMWATLMQSATTARPTVHGLPSAATPALPTVTLPAQPLPPQAPWEAATPSAGPADRAVGESGSGVTGSRPVGRPNAGGDTEGRR